MIVKENKKEQITHRYPANPYLQIKVLLTDAVFNASYKDVQHNFFDGGKIHQRKKTLILNGLFCCAFWIKGDLSDLWRCRGGLSAYYSRMATVRLYLCPCDLDGCTFCCPKKAALWLLNRIMKQAKTAIVNWLSLKDAQREAGIKSELSCRLHSQLILTSSTTVPDY